MVLRLQLASSGTGRASLVDGDASALKSALSDGGLSAELGETLYQQLMLPDTLVRFTGPSSHSRTCPFGQCELNFAVSAPGKS